MAVDKIFLDDSSHLTSAQQTELNSVLRSEYNRFQRKSYQAENNTEPLVKSEGSPVLSFVRDFSSRKYNGVNQLSFQLLTSKFDVDSSYQIITGVSGGIICSGDDSGFLRFYIKEGAIYAYVESYDIPSVCSCTVVIG